MHIEEALVVVGIKGREGWAKTGRGYQSVTTNDLAEWARHSVGGGEGAVFIMDQC